MSIMYKVYVNFPIIKTRSLELSCRENGYQTIVGCEDIYDQRDVITKMRRPAMGTTTMQKKLTWPWSNGGPSKHKTFWPRQWCELGLKWIPVHLRFECGEHSIMMMHVQPYVMCGGENAVQAHRFTHLWHCIAAAVMLNRCIMMYIVIIFSLYYFNASCIIMMICVCLVWHH